MAKITFSGVPHTFKDAEPFLRMCAVFFDDDSFPNQDETVIEFKFLSASEAEEVQKDMGLKFLPLAVGVDVETSFGYSDWYAVLPDGTIGSYEGGDL